MDLAHPGPVDRESEPSRSRAGRVGAKAFTAGVTVATAGALAVAPVVVTATPPDVRVEPSVADVQLSAFQNPLEVWLDVFTGPTGLLYQLETLGERTSTHWRALADALGDPEVQARFTSFIRNTIDDPMRIPNALLAAPGKYGPVLSAAAQNTGQALVEAFAGLFFERQARNERGALLWLDENGQPTTDETITRIPHMAPPLIQETIRLLAEGNFTDAFAEVNLWFLMDVLSDQRAGFLDALRVPGNFLEDLGAETLARVLGTTWMDPLDEDGEIRHGWGPGLLSRARLGNFARAILAPPVTALFQTMEILDAAATALANAEYDTAISHLINAPAKIANAFINGYASDLENADDYFPGLFSYRGTFNFFFSDVPADIANVLRLTRPESEESTASITGIPGSEPAVQLALKSAPEQKVARDAQSKVEKDAPETPATQEPATQEPATEETAHQEPVTDETAPESSEGTTGGELITSGASRNVRKGTSLKQWQDKAAERRQLRTEKVQQGLQNLQSNVRKNLGFNRGGTDSQDTGAANNNAGTSKVRSESSSDDE